MAALPTPGPEQLRQVSLSYAMEQARLPGYETVPTADEIIANANDFYEYIKEGTVPDLGDE